MVLASIRPWDTVQGDYPYLVDRKTLDLILNEVSGERAWDLASQITRFDRVRGGGEGSGFNDCVEWLEKKLSDHGFEVKVNKYKSDGAQKYYQWTSLTGWKVREAELWLKEPREKLFSRYTEQPVSLMHYSKGCDAEAELVYVGAGKGDSDYDGKDVKGKIVLATGGDGHKVHGEAVLKRGALGVVVGPSDREDRMQYPDLIEHVRLSPTADELDKAGFGFSISKRQENELMSFVKSGKAVMVRAFVEALIVPGDMPVLEAVLRGSEFPSQEVVVMGHLDHYKPGGNDNASGCAGMVEIMLNIKSLVDKGVIKLPMRTLRFLFVPEMHGTIAWLSENEDIRSRGIAGMNLDMIGENGALCEANFNLTSSPLSVPGYINEVMANLLPWLEEDVFFSPKGTRQRFNYRVKPYTGGSDHLFFADSTFNVPSVMLGHRNVFHHTNMDTMATCDSTEMKRIIGLAEATCIFLANAGDDDALRIAGEVYSQAVMSLAERTRKSLLLLSQVAQDTEKRDTLSELYENTREYPMLQASLEKASILKVTELCTQAKSKRFIEELSKKLDAVIEMEMKSIEHHFASLKNLYTTHDSGKERKQLYERAAKVTPTRLFKGPLNQDYDRARYIWNQIEDAAGKDRAKWYEDNKKLAGGSKDSKVFEVCNLMDGKRTALDIRNMVSLEFDETDIEYLLNFLDDLEKLGLISYRGGKGES